MDGGKDETRLEARRYIKQGFWMWFGFFLALIAACAGIFLLFLLGIGVSGLYISVTTYLADAPKRQFKECYDKELSKYKMTLEHFSISPQEIKKLSPENRKRLALLQDARRMGAITEPEINSIILKQILRKPLMLPSVVCKGQGLTPYGEYIGR